jgi:hypothetical protein
VLEKAGTLELSKKSACLTYLSFETFASGASGSDKDFETRLAENVFFKYAVTHWTHHVLRVQEKVSQLALPFLQDEALVASTSQMTFLPRYSYPGYSQNFLKQMTGLHLPARYGLFFLLEESLCIIGAKVVIDADSRDERGRTPLSWAAGEGPRRGGQAAGKAR